MEVDPGSPIEIVPASHRDREAVVELWHACNLVVPHNPPHADFDLALGRPGSDVLVAHLDGSIIGSVMVGHDGHRGWMYYLAVASNLQGAGIGRLLITTAERWLRDRGIRKCQLMVRESNLKVIGFYEAVGYEKSPVVVMQRWLDR